MGTKKTIGIIVLIIGVILLILSLAADVVRLGVSPNFGPIQIAGTVIGALIVVIGILLLRKKKWFELFYNYYFNTVERPGIMPLGDQQMNFYSGNCAGHLVIQIWAEKQRNRKYG